MRQTITAILSLLFFAAAIMAFAYYFPWVAAGLNLITQLLIIIILSVREGRT